MIGRWMLGFAIVSTVAVVALADVFNSHHLFDEEWPAHARLHNAMQATSLLVVSGASLAALSLAPRTLGWTWVAALAPISFWSGLVIAPLVPGTSLYASEELRELGFPINFALALFYLAFTAAAVWIESKQRLDQGSQGGQEP